LRKTQAQQRGKMSRLLSELSLFGRRLSRAAECVSNVSHDAQVVRQSMNDLREIARAENVTGFFNRFIDTYIETTSEGNKILRVIGVDGNTIAMPAAEMASMLEAGDLPGFIKLTNPTLTVSKETADLFASLSRETPQGAFLQLTKNVREMRKVVEELPDSFNRVVRNQKELEESIASGGKKIQNSYKKLLLEMKPGASVGKIVVTVVGTLTAYELLKKHSQNGSGCFKITSNISNNKCKVLSYSVNKVSTCSCVPNEVNPVKRDKKDWAESRGPCLKACSDEYLMLTDRERETVTYRCLDLDIFDAMGDIIDDVTLPLEKLLSSDLIAKVALAFVGVASATIVLKRLSRQQR
jgi:hypothetical protein